LSELVEAAAAKCVWFQPGAAAAAGSCELHTVLLLVSHATCVLVSALDALSNHAITRNLMFWSTVYHGIMHACCCRELVHTTQQRCLYTWCPTSGAARSRLTTCYVV
jgi:hypothetical protein